MLGTKLAAASVSVRLAVFAFALSSWVEGYSQLRHSASSPSSSVLDSYILTTLDSDDINDSLDELNGDRDNSDSSRLSKWLRRRGRRVDSEERAIMGLVDVTNALGILHLLRSRPLFPFLLTPLFTTIPLPGRNEDLKSLRWTKVILASVVLCLLRELQRISIVHGITLWRRRRDRRDGIYQGPIVVRGRRIDSLIDNDEDEEDEKECMICAAGQNDLSQSISSLSSQVPTDIDDSPSSSSSSLGPLEAFCTIAPGKHVAHRECFLRWHSAYQSQRRLQSQELDLPVIIPPTSMPDSADNRSNIPAAERQLALRRAKALLKSAGQGFAYLLTSITPSRTSSSPSLPPSSTSHSTLTSGGSRQPSQLFQPTFTLHYPREHHVSSSNTQGYTRGTVPPGQLATLQTLCPPCPGCRSAVELHFWEASPVISCPPPPLRSNAISFGKVSALLESIRSSILDFATEGTSLVTGRTIALSLTSQLSFLLTMMSMAQARRERVK